MKSDKDRRSHDDFPMSNRSSFNSGATEYWDGGKTSKALSKYLWNPGIGHGHGNLGRSRALRPPNRF